MDPHASRVLGAVVEAIGDASGYPDALHRICRAVALALPSDRATIYTHSRRARTFLPKADHGTPSDVVARFAARGFAARVFPGTSDLAAGRVFVATRDTAAPEMRIVLEEARLTALAAAPLLFNGEAEGTIACGFERADGFARIQIRALQHVARHVAVLVRNARVESDAAGLATRRTWLATWAAQVLAAPDVPAIGDLLTRVSRDLFRTSGAWILLVEGNELIGRQASGPARGDVVARIPLDAVAASTDALRAGRVLVVNDYAESPYGRGPAAQRFRPASVLVAPLVDDAGPVGVLMVHDLEHPRRFRPSDEEDARILAAIATAALRKVLLVDAVTRASRAKDDFLATVSHDLRTPLNIIAGYGQLLREETFGPVTADQADTLDRMLRTVGDQLTLTNDLLDLARIEQGKLAVTPQPMAVADLVPSLQETMRALLRRRPIAFETDVPAGVIAHADPERVRQVLVNLLTNAAKFTNAGCIRLVAAAHEGAVRVTVEDTGPGIDPAIRERVLEPFVRGESPQAGSGLGLSIVARLVAAMGGGVAIESGGGTGTRVAVTLPASYP